MVTAGMVGILNRLLGMARIGVLLSGVLCSSAVVGRTPASVGNMHTYSTAWPSYGRELDVESLRQKIQIKVFVPPDYSAKSTAQYPSLYLNDGQDADAVALAETLQRLHEERKISPVIVVAVSMLPDRMATYGYSDRNKQISLPAETRYGPVGNQAHAYSEWFALELVPYIDRHYRTIARPEARAILGWSLGAANAFNIGWNYPDVFGKVGGFSPSFWLSAGPGNPPVAIVQTLIEQKPIPEKFSLWLAAGDAEETDDRDKDGVIDVIDDAQGVIEALSAKVMSSGHSETRIGLQLTPIAGGQHNQQSWKRMLPEFLIWAYPASNGRGK